MGLKSQTESDKLGTEVYISAFPLVKRAFECRTLQHRTFTYCSDTAMRTIQELLADKPSDDDPQPVQYVGTVEAYDKWAEVRTDLTVSGFTLNLAN